MKFLGRLGSHCSPVAILFTVSFAFAALASAPSACWPQFPAIGSLGIAKSPNLPDRWSTNENIAWKVDVPGRGWSSPIVWNERVFLTSVTSDGEMEAPKKGLYFGGE